MVRLVLTLNQCLKAFEIPLFDFYHLFVFLSQELNKKILRLCGYFIFLSEQLKTQEIFSRVLYDRKR